MQKKLLFFLIFTFLNIYPSAYAEYTGGSGDGWDHTTITQLMYHGGSGDGHAMSASAADTPIAYSTAAKLVFNVSPPSGAYAGIPFNPQPVVYILDAYGNLVLNAVNSVTLSIGNDPAPGGGTFLSGVKTMQAVAGVANYAGKGLNLTRAASGFTLQAESAGLTSAVSSPFNVPSPIQVTQPNGGELWTVSTAYEIRWSAYGLLTTGTNKIEYSLDNGSNWMTLTANGTSPYSWVTPSASSTQALVRVSNSADVTFTDTSDSTFRLAAGFRVISPNGAEVWSNDHAHTIFWATTGTVANVKIEYYNGLVWSAIEGSVVNANQYTWMPNLAAGGTNFKIRVSDAQDPQVYDESNNAFTVQRLKLTAPAQGQRVQAGSGLNMTWSAVGLNSVKIDYSFEGGAWTQIVASTPAGAGSYTWNVPNDFTTSTDVRLRITNVDMDSDGNYISDVSGSFTVYGQLTLNVPNGGEQWSANVSQDITWSTNRGTIRNVKLEYSADNFVLDVNTIVNSTSNTNLYSWTPTTTGTTYKIRVSDSQDAQTNDASNDYFSITGIGVTTPGGGETWDVGSQQTLAWNYTGAIDNVKLEYFDGTAWRTITASTPNIRSYPWIVADAATTSARIRVSDAVDGDPAGTSNTFGIRAPVTVLEPDGGEIYSVGGAATIRWSNTGTINTVRIEFFDGSSWRDIEVAYPNPSPALGGSYQWTLPDAVTALAKVRVSDADAGHPASSDESNTSFTIKASLDIDTPAADWAVNETHNITWTSAGTVPLIKLYYATEIDGYATWGEITSGPAQNTGSYSWKVPDLLLALGQDPQQDPNLAVKLQLVDAVAGHPPSYSVSGAFNVVYYTITFTVKDSLTASNLSGLSVNCTSGWSASNLTSGVNTRHNYGYGSYTTVWSKPEYSDKSIDFIADSSKTIDIVLELTLLATQEYHVYSNFTYDSVSGTFVINSWMERLGSTIPNPSRCTITIYDNANNLVDLVPPYDSGDTALVSTTPDTNGVFRQVWDVRNNPNLSAESTYLGHVEILYGATVYKSNVVYSIAIPAVAQLAAIGEGVAAIRASVGGDLAGKVEYIRTGVDEMKTDVGKIKTAVGADEAATLYSRVAEILQDTGVEIPATIEKELKKGPRSKILNRPTSVNVGDTVTVRYKTDSGLAPLITVYDADNTARISNAQMTEIGLTGVYEYDVTFSENWGTGDFTVICSEPVTASADSMVINVSTGTGLTGVENRLEALSASIAAIGRDVSDIKTTSQALYDDLSAVEGSLANVNANWAGYTASDIMSHIDDVESGLGTPADQAGLDTVFGKLAYVYDQTLQIPQAAANAASAYNSVEDLRKEIDFNGKSETAYRMLTAINSAVYELKQLVLRIPDDFSAEDIKDMAASFDETREALKQLAAQDGMAGIVPEEAPPASLEDLQNRAEELKALLETIKAMLEKKEEPVIKTWLESGSVTLKMVVANPSQTQARTVPVKQYLPKEITPEDIQDKGGFELNYDFDQSLYYAYQEVALEPKETAILQIVMNDVWTIGGDELDDIRDHIGRLMTILEKSDYYEQAKVLADNVLQRVERIAAGQAAAGLRPQEKLSAYDTNLGVLKEVKKDIAILEDLVVESGGLPTAKIMGEDFSLAEAVSAGLSAVETEKLGLLKFRIELSNTLDKEKSFELKYYLPIETRPEHVVDRQDLELLYDYKRGAHYVYKEAVQVAAGAKKEYTVTVKDVWVVPEENVRTLKAHIAKLLGILRGSEYNDAAGFLANRADGNLETILRIQAKAAESVDRHIGDYRANLKRFDEARKDAAKLERLVVQAGGKPGLTLATRDIKVKEGGIIPAAGEAEEDLRYSARGLELIAKSIFKNKMPNPTTTWRIIWSIIAFLGVISFMFFMLWWVQIKMNERKK